MCCEKSKYVEHSNGKHLYCENCGNVKLLEPISDTWIAPNTPWIPYINPPYIPYYPYVGPYVGDVVIPSQTLPSVSTPKFYN